MEVLYLPVCTRCGGTGSRKFVKLSKECISPTTRGQYNIEAYAGGEAPAGYKDWPYKRVHLNENIVISNVRILSDKMNLKMQKNSINKKKLNAMSTTTRYSKRIPMIQQEKLNHI